MVECKDPESYFTIEICSRRMSKQIQWQMKDAGWSRGLEMEGPSVGGGVYDIGTVPFMLKSCMERKLVFCQAYLADVS